jgi:hypothetical protein
MNENPDNSTRPKGGDSLPLLVGRLRNAVDELLNYVDHAPVCAVPNVCDCGLEDLVERANALPPPEGQRASCPESGDHGDALVTPPSGGGSYFMPPIRNVMVRKAVDKHSSNVKAQGTRRASARRVPCRYLLGMP